MDALDVLEQVESVSGKNEKTKILADNKHNTDLQELLDAALNFKRKFFIKKFEYYPVDDLTNENCHYAFMQMLKQLENREITGNTAIDKVHRFLSLCNEKQAKWYGRVLKKDLRSGFSISTANKAGFNIPVFDVMLAKDANKCKKLEEIIGKGVYVTPKFDGYRCVAVCIDGDVTLFSRNGTNYSNFPSVADSLRVASMGTAFVLDGEIMSDDFNAMQQSAFASVRGTAVGDVKYYIFGLIPNTEWESEVFKLKTGERLRLLEGLYDRLCEHSNLEIVDHAYTDSLEECRKLEQIWLAQGYEGAMVLPDIPYYKGKKSNKLLKFKTMLSQDCEIIGVYEGTGKYENMMGGMHLLQEDGVTRCDVGSGFSDEDRARIWSDRSSVIGRVAEIKYQELTPDGVMRFPIFLRYREDKQ